jgi:hypothetical protein
MYNPDLGTFNQRDPIEADSNLYRYCGNDPIGATDPSGLDKVDGIPVSVEPVIGDTSFGIFWPP